jgi:hypothetical protein
MDIVVHVPPVESAYAAKMPDRQFRRGGGKLGVILKQAQDDVFTKCSGLVPVLVAICAICASCSGVKCTSIGFRIRKNLARDNPHLCRMVQQTGNKIPTPVPAQHAGTRVGHPLLISYAALFLHQTLIQHRVSDLQESSYICAVHQVAGRAVFLGRFIAVLVDGDHDLVQTIVDFLAGPGDAHTVL